MGVIMKNGVAYGGGISPVVSITSIAGGHTVTIMDADHPNGQSFNVMDGTDGAAGISLSGTIETTNWTGAAAPYVAEIAASGLLATDKPVVDVVMSGTYATDESLDEAWGLIYRAVAGADTITFYAREVPAIDLPFSLFVVRE